MNLKIKTRINVLPFGSINYKSMGPSFLKPKKLKERPNYSVPLTTDIESLEFNFIDETFPIPADSEERLE